MVSRITRGSGGGGGSHLNGEECVCRSPDGEVEDTAGNLGRELEKYMWRHQPVPTCPMDETGETAGKEPSKSLGVCLKPGTLRSTAGKRARKRTNSTLLGTLLIALTTESVF